jgi:glycosyltransferase involved in cell wall biosynthesis
MASSAQVPWLIVNPAFTRRGGQELANHALARRIAETGRWLTLVAHEIDADLEAFPNVRALRRARPAGSQFLGERALQWLAESEHTRLRRAGPVFFIGNAGNSPTAQVSWVHFVHAAWTESPAGAPKAVRAVHWLKKKDALSRERAAFHNAELVISNSDRTTHDLARLVGVPRDKIVRIWFGAERSLVSGPIDSGRPRHLLFVGALGWDRRKGLDIVLEAFAQMARDPVFGYRLVVAGAGTERPWAQLARDLGVSDRVDFLSFVDDVPHLLATADLLLSPARYEAYGLAVQEAIMAGVPVLVAAGSTGIGERLPADFVVAEPRRPESWVGAIGRALHRLPSLRGEALSVAEMLAERSWAGFADEFIEVVESRLSNRASRQRAPQRTTIRPV